MSMLVKFCHSRIDDTFFCVAAKGTVDGRGRR
jgi:hypothetical protein